MSDHEEDDIESESGMDDDVSEDSHDTNEEINDQLSGRRPMRKKKSQRSYRDDYEEEVDEEASREDLINKIKGYLDDDVLGPIVKRNKKVIKDEKILDTMSLEDLERQRDYCRRSIAKASQPKIIRTTLHSLMPAIEQWAVTHPVVRQKVKARGIADAIVGNPKKGIKPDLAVDLTIRELDIEMTGGMTVNPWLRLPMALGAAVHAVHSKNLAFELLVNYVHQYGTLPDGFVHPPDFKTSADYLHFIKQLIATGQQIAASQANPAVVPAPGLTPTVAAPVNVPVQRPAPRVSIPTLNTSTVVKPEEKESKEDDKPVPVPISNWRLRAVGLPQTEVKTNE